MKDFAEDQLGFKHVDVGDGCVFSQKSKYWFGFATKIFVVINLLFAFAFLAAAAYNLPKNVLPSQWRSYKNFENIVTGTMCLVMFFVFLLITFFGGVAVSCRTAFLCNSCLSLWTFIVGIVLFSVGSILYGYDDWAQTLACDNAITTEIRNMLDNFVEKNMCSDGCPCDQAGFVDGGWEDIDAGVLSEFGRQPRGGADAALISLVSSADQIDPTLLSPTIQAILAQQGFAAPPVVNNYA